ncbi:hypothetical protein [Maricaulis sp.]|uniref:hypothetical protein n=1 Tax=Maricaulis sp. TaxID=1486257 RepID=UPI002B271E23|nr:hypothetical protein [Maricaulis sp.]
MSPEMRQKLKKALAGRTSVDMGQFQFLNLERVRARAGEDWPKLREKVYETSTQFIERRIKPDDVMLRVQGGFLIIFKAADVEAADEIVDAISGELNTFFLGQPELAEVRAEGEARDVPTHELLDIVARSQPHEPEPDPKKPAKVAPVRGGEQAPPWQTAPVKERDDDDRTRWVEGPRPEPRGRPSIVAGASPASSGPRPSWDDIVFKPCWDSRKAVISHSLCVARKVIDGFAYYGRETLSGSADRDQHRQLDRAIALAAQRGFQRARAAKRAGMIVVPVHYDSLSSVSRRMAYFKVLQPIPEPARKFFLLRVDGIPDGAPMAQMQEVFRSMKHFGAYVLAHHAFGSQRLDRFESCGIGVLSAETPARLNDGGVSEKDLLACVDWVTAGRSLTADTWLTQIGNPALVEAAMSAGVRYFSGPVIGQESDQPIPARRLGLADILNPPTDDEEGDDTFEID